MDYKQKYKEALERARDLHDNHALGMPFIYQTCEYIFPELRESEDEKIIRTLKEIVNWGCAKNISVENNVELKDCLAWIEKQGEQKSKTNFLKFRIGDKVTNGEDTYTINFIGKDCYLVKEHDCTTIPFEYQHHWKLVEQKPVEQDTEIHDLWVYIREWNEKFGRLPKDEDELAACIDYVMKRQKPTDKVEPKFKKE